MRPSAHRPFDRFLLVFKREVDLQRRNQSAESVPLVVLDQYRWYKHALAFLANSAHSSPGPIVTANESKATADAAKQPAEHEAESGSAQAALVPSHTLEELKARFGGGRDADCVYAAPVEGVLTPLLDRSKQLRVEVLCGNRTDAMNNPSATLVLSKYSTLDDLRDEASEALGFDAYNARCVDFYNHSWCACCMGS